MSRESISLALSELRAFFALHSAPRLNLCRLSKQVCKTQNQTRNKLKFLFFCEIWLQCVLVLKHALVCIIIVQFYFNSWSFPVFPVRVEGNGDLARAEGALNVAAAEGPWPYRARCYWDALGTVTVAWCLQHAHTILHSVVTSRAASWFTPLYVEAYLILMRYCVCSGCVCVRRGKSLLAWEEGKSYSTEAPMVAKPFPVMSSFCYNNCV